MPQTKKPKGKSSPNKPNKKKILLSVLSLPSIFLSWWFGGYAMTNWWHINPLFGSILVVIAIMLWVVIFLWLYCQKWIFGSTKSYKKPLIIVSVLVVLVIGFGGWLGKQSLIDSFPQSSHQVVIPIFGAPLQENYTVDVGTVTVGMNINELEQHPVNIAQIGSSQITAIMDNEDNFYVNVTITDGVNTVSINYNKPTKLPRGWDFNYFGSQCEIVNSQLQPIFQMSYDATDSNVIINGIFPMGTDSVAVATNGGLLTMPTSSLDFSLNRLFKYPSWKYLHQLISTH